MTNNHKYSHIKSFKDFENEKIKLHYLIKISEKKMEIKKLEIREYISPIRFFSSIFNDLAQPTIKLIKSIITHRAEKKKKKKGNKQESDDKN